MFSNEEKYKMKDGIHDAQDGILSQHHIESVNTTPMWNESAEVLCRK